MYKLHVNATMFSNSKFLLSHCKALEANIWQVSVCEMNQCNGLHKFKCVHIHIIKFTVST